MKTFIFGTALPNTAKETLTKKFNAIKGAAIKVPRTKTLATSPTYSSIGLTCKKKLPIGRISKLIINAFKTNALFQVDNISQEEAKKRYIELSKKYLLNRSK